MRISLTLRWLAFGGLVLLLADRIRSIDSVRQPYLLLHHVRLAEVELPVAWFSLRDLELRGEPFVEPGHGLVLPTEKVAEDILVASRAGLAEALAGLPPAEPGQVVVPPGPDAIVVCWERSSRVVRVEHSAWLGETELASPAVLLLSEAVHVPDPVTGKRPLRSEVPPRETRWMPGREIPGARDPEPRGLGYLELHGAGGMLFAASGDLAEGPSSLEAWLNVAMDLRGDLYFWFSAD